MGVNKHVGVHFDEMTAAREIQRFVNHHDSLNQHVGVNFHEITAVPGAREIQVSRKGDTMQGDLDMGIWFRYEGKREQYEKNLHMAAGSVHRWRKFFDAVSCAESYTPWK